MPDASPTKWHRAHTTWFFETFLLVADLAGLPRVRPGITAISSIPITRRSGRAIRGPSAGCCRGRAWPRSRLSRRMSTRRWTRSDRATSASAVVARRSAPLVELGLNHEEQHQELILMDIKHALSLNPLQPAYARAAAGRAPHGAAARLRRGSPAACARSATTAPASPSTTRGRATRSGSSPFGWPRGSSPAANISTSSPTAAIAGRNSGCRTAGRRCSARAGRRRSIGARGRTATGRVFTLSRPARARRRRAGLPCQLLRGRRLCPLGGQAPADRGRMGGRGGRDRPTLDGNLMRPRPLSSRAAAPARRARSR